MPDIADIERRLRLPAPDEPMFLPALELPWGEPGSRVQRTSIRAGRSSATFTVVSPRLAFAVLLLLAALVGAILTGALRLDRLQGPLDPDRGFAVRGVTIDLPDDWIRLTPDGPSQSGASTALVASSLAVDGCTAAELPEMTEGNAVPVGNEVEVPPPSGPVYQGIEDQVFACALDRPMQPGETRIALSFGLAQEIGVGPIEPFDAEAWYGPGADLGTSVGFYMPNEADGWTDTIDGMPAKVVVVPGSDPSGPDEVRTWGVYDPLAFDQLWFIRLALKGPDLETMRASADAMAKSLRFDTRAAPLVADDRDALLAQAIDRLDRESREFRGTRLFGCFPRTPGVQDVRLNDGPGGPLPEPVDVTCTTTVEMTPLGVWRAELLVSWDAGGDRAAGSWGWELFFGADPSLGAQSELHGNLATVFPGLDGPLPAPLEAPLVIPMGSIVQVLPPGVDQTGGPTQAMYQDPDPIVGVDSLVFDAQPGTRFAVVGGPVTHHGTDWYRVEASSGTTYPSGWAWLPVNDGAQPLVRVVDPVCAATPTIDDLLALTPAERVACYGGVELTLEPVVAARAEEMQGEAVEGSPSWLAKDTLWRLYGEAGPGGVDGAIAVTIAPGAGDDLPTGPALRVTGHFDDPAAATCERIIPDSWGGPETPDMQHLRCRELFVVTSVDERSTP